MSSLLCKAAPHSGGLGEIEKQRGGRLYTVRRESPIVLHRNCLKELLRVWPVNYVIPSVKDDIKAVV